MGNFLAKSIGVIKRFVNANGLKPLLRHSATVRLEPLYIADMSGVSPPRVLASKKVPGLEARAATISCLPAAHA